MVNTVYNSDKLLVYHRGDKVQLEVDDILMIEAQSNYSYIFLRSGMKFLTSKTLKFWISKLNTNKFIKIHAKYYVQFGCVKQWNRANHEVVLENGIALKISRRLRKGVYGSIKTF